MTLVKYFAVASLLCLVLQFPVFVFSSRQKIKRSPFSSLPKGSANVTDKQELEGTLEDTIDEDFPPLSFYIQDVNITSLERSNQTSSAGLNYTNTNELDFDGLPVLANDSIKESLPRLNYETFWSNGSLTLTLVELKKLQGMENATQDVWSKMSDFELEDPNLVPSQLEDVKDHNTRRHRRKRAVFGGDDRVKVRHIDSRRLPYSAVVRISTGCTGTLISEYHVLTAAHCVHDGMNYLVDVKHLKVLVLRHQRKVIRIGVDYVKVPRGWTLSRDYRYDYSVIRLKRTHNNGYLGMYEIPEALDIRIKIQFASFPSDKEKNTLWYSNCVAHCRSHAIINRCDSNFGSSGAGIYALMRRGEDEERFVFGVFTGLGSRVRFRGKLRLMNIGTKITPLKLAQIRAWMGLPPRRHKGSNAHKTLAKMPVSPKH